MNYIDIVKGSNGNFCYLLACILKLEEVASNSNFADNSVIDRVIAVQLSCRSAVLTSLLDLTKGYAKHESETLIETIKSRRSVITAKSKPDDVMRQEGVISEALGRIAMVTEQTDKADMFA